MRFDYRYDAARSSYQMLIGINGQWKSLFSHFYVLYKFFKFSNIAFARNVNISTFLNLLEFSRNLWVREFEVYEFKKSNVITDMMTPNCNYVKTYKCQKGKYFQIFLLFLCYVVCLKVYIPVCISNYTSDKGTDI